MYLLDTNFWVVYLRGKSPLVKQRLAAHATSEIATCSVVLGELLFGALCSAKPAENRRAVETLLAPYVCFSFEELAADHFASIRHRLELQGSPIGPYDLQIAAIARANDCTLVTHNTRDFQRVPGLRIEDWEVP